MKYYIEKKSFMALLNKIDVLAQKTKRNFKFNNNSICVSCLPYNIHLGAVALGWVFDPDSYYQEDKDGYIKIDYELGAFIYDKIAGLASVSAFSGFDIAAFVVSRIFNCFCTYQDKGDNRYYTFFNPSNNQILKIN